MGSTIRENTYLPRRGEVPEKAQTLPHMPSLCTLSRFLAARKRARRFDDAQVIRSARSSSAPDKQVGGKIVSWEIPDRRHRSRAFQHIEIMRAQRLRKVCACECDCWTLTVSASASLVLHSIHIVCFRIALRSVHLQEREVCVGRLRARGRYGCGKLYSISWDLL